ncbi:MAG: PLP-dependent aspartate aminotransferase family protein, partial [Actinomycetota bacterium]
MPSGAPLGVPLSSSRFRSLATRAVHPPAATAQPGVPVAPVLDPSSTYGFSDSESFAEASQAKVGAGYVYTRWANPTIDAFESSVADLEGAEAAEAFASGMAAISSIYLALCSQGDTAIVARQLYGGTHALTQTLLPRFGIETTLVDVDDYDAIEKSLDGAKLLYCETIGNPRIVAADIPRLAELAQAADVPLVVDNTFASPVLCRPLELGASVSVHSATKFLGGHHDLMGGVVCASTEMIEVIADLARELGPTLSPFNAWLALRGIATLPLRVERSSRSALAVAEALSAHPKVSDVCYPGLEGDPSKA